MMKTLLSILLSLSFATAFAQYPATRQNAALVREERYVTNSPGNGITNSKLIEITKDSTFRSFLQPSISFPLFGSSRNDGTPTTILWTDANGFLKKSPMPSFITTELDPVWTGVSGNYRTKIQNDALYYPLSGNPSNFLTSFTELDPTVPAYAKTLSAFSIIKSSTDSLYYPLAGNPSGFLTSISSSDVASALGYTPVSPATLTSTLSSYATISALTSGLAGKENAITAGTTAQYWRGDKSWQTLNTSAVPESGSLYYTDARSRGAISLTTTGSLGTTPTYNSSTGVLNVPIGSTATVTSVGVASSDFSVSGTPVTTSGNITLNLNTTGVSANTYDRVTVDTKGRVTAGFNRQTPVAIASGSKSFNTAYQVSATNDAYLTVSPQISCNLSLSGGQAGTITLEISANGTSGWVLMGVVSGSNTGTLTIGLNTTQVSGAPMFAYVPAGYYYRMTTNNTIGSPSYVFNGGNYTLN